MTKKNRINPLEAHFEKAILVVVCVVLLAVVAMQFLTQPNAVQVGGSSTPVPPDRVFEPIREEAEAVLAQMRSVDPPLPEVPEQNVAERFAQVSTLDIADSIQVTMMGDSVSLERREIGPAGGDASTVYAMPALPAPANVVAATYRATIDPYVAINNEELRALLPAEQPFDAVAVSVEGLIDGQALSESMEADPDGDEGPMRPLPLSWWRGNLELLGVEVERQALGDDGQWGAAEVISGLPGGESLLSEARTGGITAAELVQVARSAQNVVREVAQPAFPPTIAGPEWVPPSEMTEEAGLSEEQQEIARLERQYESLQRRVDGLMLQREQLGGGSGRDPGGREERSGGGRSREGGGQPDRQPSVDRDQQRREVLERQIAAVQEQMTELAGRLADLGAPVDAQDTAATTGREQQPPLPPLLAADEMPVWVHDFAAEPGKTYRYRMRVVVNNPLYAKEQYLSGDQREAASSPTLEGPWSAWSDVVPVEDNRHFFVLSASQSDAIGAGPRAAVEVYEFYYGYWRRASTTLEPGDTIHAQADLPDNLLLWDLARLEEQGPQGRRLLETPRGPGGGLDDPRAPEDRRRREFEGLPGGEFPRDPRAPQPPAAGGEEELPEGVERAPGTLDLNLAAMLLDVAAMPGQSDAQRVVLRDPSGRLVTRLTGEDRASPLYRRLAANAREGEEQGRPEADPNEGRPTPPPMNEDRRWREEGGGGAGGG